MGAAELSEDLGPGRSTPQALSDPTALASAVLEAVRQLMAGAPAVEAVGWAWEERSQAIATLDRVGALVGVYRSGLLAAHKDDGRWARNGDRSFEGFRGRTTKSGFGAARREMELAEGLQRMPQAARAVERGDVGLEHAGVLSRLHARASEQVREALAAGGTDHLLAAARGLDAAAFAKRAEAWAAGQDVAAVERSHEQVRRRRYCRVTDRDGGTRMEAFVDSVAGAVLRTALEALTPVPANGDERTPEQRRADALTTMASRVLDAGGDKIGAQIRPHISLLVPAETWAGVQARRRHPRAGRRDVGPARDARGGSTPAGDTLTGDTPAGDKPAGPVPMPELDDGTVVPLSELERIACDCEVTRIVLGADSEPLDVGRTQRTYAGSLRRAVLVRDGHCRWPGCTIRGAWCEVHHVRWYSRGGVTSVENGLALCSFHHHEVHRRDVTIRATPGGHLFTRQDGTDIGLSRRPARGSSRKRGVSDPPQHGALRQEGDAAPGASLDGALSASVTVRVRTATATVRNGVGNGVGTGRGSGVGTRKGVDTGNGVGAETRLHAPRPPRPGAGPEPLGAVTPSGRGLPTPPTPDGEHAEGDGLW